MDMMSQGQDCFFVLSYYAKYQFSNLAKLPIPFILVYVKLYEVSFPSFHFISLVLFR